MTLQQLRYAIGIAETGSFNKAAEKLYISQPSLTAAIKDLEDELNILIFNRTSRGVKLTSEGEEFVAYARELYHHYESVLDKYGKIGKRKKKFGVSTQHYSFAVKSFVETVKLFDTDKYEFAIRETRTKEVIEDVASFKSDIGILYLSDFNRKIIMNLLNARDLAFHKLIRPMCTCGRGIRLPTTSSLRSMNWPNTRAFLLNRATTARSILPKKY